MEGKQPLPEYLKQLRRAYNYKQEHVAAALHISRQTYSHYETGRITPSVKALYNLARFYGISVDEIMRHMEFSYPGNEK